MAGNGGASRPPLLRLLARKRGDVEPLFTILSDALVEPQRAERGRERPAPHPSFSKPSLAAVDRGVDMDRDLLKAFRLAPAGSIAQAGQGCRRSGSDTSRPIERAPQLPVP